jgi:hypothetical protein
VSRASQGQSAAALPDAGLGLPRLASRVPLEEGDAHAGRDQLDELGRLPMSLIAWLVLGVCLRLG